MRRRTIALLAAAVAVVVALVVRSSRPPPGSVEPAADHRLRAPQQVATKAQADRGERRRGLE